jgi:UDP-glucose 6-dehydrogenase
MRIGIVGGGFVGSATALLRCAAVEVLIWDLAAGAAPAMRARVGRLFALRALPDLRADAHARRHLDCRGGAGVTAPIVVRSTVPVGTVCRLGCAMMPEFLTERAWRADVAATARWVLGTRAEDDSACALVQALLSVAHAPVNKANPS